jgi:hypothetical protein
MYLYSLQMEGDSNDKGWSSSLWIGLTTLHRKNKFVTKNQTEPRTWTDSLDKRTRRRNMDMRFTLWNVTSLYRAGSLKTVWRELSKYKLDLVGVQEVRCEGGGTEPAGEREL